MKYDIKPVPKPRMTRADVWKQRPPVLLYRAFADECRLRGVHVAESGCKVIFELPMPKSWSSKKKSKMFGQPHQQTPDIDNLLKALLDAIYAQDKGVWDIAAMKVWGTVGSITIEAQNG